MYMARNFSERKKGIDYCSRSMQKSKSMRKRHRQSQMHTSFTRFLLCEDNFGIFMQIQDFWDSDEPRRDQWHRKNLSFCISISRLNSQIHSEPLSKTINSKRFAALSTPPKKIQYVWLVAFCCNRNDNSEKGDCIFGGLMKYEQTNRMKRNKKNWVREFVNKRFEHPINNKVCWLDAIICVIRRFFHFFWITHLTKLGKLLCFSKIILIKIYILIRPLFVRKPSDFCTLTLTCTHRVCYF